MVKTKKLLAVLVCAAMVMGILPALTVGAAEITPTQPEFGTGTSTDPYQIGTAAELYWFAAQVNSGKTSICAELTADIVVNEKLLKADGTPRKSGEPLVDWEPINNYSGTFNGKNHTISGLYVNDGVKTNVGLFGVISGGKVTGVGVIDSYFFGANYIGGICGKLESSATIERCYNGATLELSGSIGSGAAIYIGGICAFISWSKNQITYCYNIGLINAEKDINVYGGGIYGYSDGYGMVISSCMNYGNIINQKNGYFGGVCAGIHTRWGEGATLKNCFSLAGIVAIGENQGSYIYNVATKTIEEFSSGEVAYLLNDEWSGSGIWYQNIGEDAYPTLDSSKGKIYYGYTHNGTEAIYSNSPLHEDPGDHDSMYENGICTVCGKNENGLVTGIELDKTALNIPLGGEETLTATIIPENAENKNVVWASSDISVATVSNGTVTAVKEGTATITVTTVEGGYTAICAVTVKEKPIEVENAADVTVGNVTARAGETVAIPVSIANNPGIAGFNLTINYDKTKLTPVSIEKGSALTAGTLTSNIQQGGDMNEYDCVTAYWVNPADVTANGEILTLTFTISEETEEGEIPVTVTYEIGDISNQNYEDIVLNITNGGVTVKNIIKGDVYTDGLVNTKDGVRLSQYLAKWEVNLTAAELAAADVLADGVVNTKDGVKLSQYLAKWDVSLEAVSLLEQGRIKFEVGEVSAKAGEYVDIPVTITENTGVAGFNVQLDYDKTKLTPVSITQDSALTAGTLTSNIQQGGDMSRFDCVTAYWVNPSNITATGEAFTVRFQIAEDAEGEIPVTLTYDETDVPCDQNLNELEVEIVNGAVIIDEVKSADYTINSLAGEIPAEGGSFYAEVSVTKNTDRAAKDMIIIAVYKDGILVDITYMKSEFTKGQTVIFGGKLTAPEGAVLKAFVWDSTEGMQSLSNSMEK